MFTITNRTLYGKKKATKSTEPKEPKIKEFDLVIIGAGSGGLSLSKEAALLGKSVAVLDLVTPSPHGTTWGVGGTCVNVGCIPKKLMHQASLLGEAIEDAEHYGWKFPTGSDGKPAKPTHDWETMVNAVQDHIGSLNFGYRVRMKETGVTFLNAYGSFVDSHTVLAQFKNKTEVLKAKHIAIAVGGRPRELDIVGSEHVISSDDLFSLPTDPGKCLVIGASYVALECAGFLTGVGKDTTVMARSIFLRGFDQDMAEKSVKYMENHGTKLLRGFVPVAISKNEAGRLEVTYRPTACGEGDTTEDVTEEYDTVMAAVGRDPCTPGLNLQNAKVEVNPRTGKIDVDQGEQTNVPHIFALGDVIEGKPELTPVAIKAAKLLAHRLYSERGAPAMDYDNVATAVFTPLEYGAVGLSEEDAIARKGEDGIEVYHSNFKPLEWTVAQREDNACYAKVIVDKEDDGVMGVHILGPNAGEVVQGFSLGLKLGMTYEDLQDTIGIHPTNAEELCQLHITKSSGEDPTKTGC